jgi:transcriptional regulator with XRE-family HTH domain
VPSLKAQLASIVRTARLDLDVTQAELGRAIGISRSLVAHIEAGRANPSVDVVDRIATALDMRLELVARTPTVVAARTRDAVHALCLAYVERRLRAAGFETRREVEFIVGRSHGWCELIAFDVTSGLLLIVEIKTRLDDIGGVERQLSWYERASAGLARSAGWRPSVVRSLVLVLASREADDSISQNRGALRAAFPARGRDVGATLTDRDARSAVWNGRALALIDPRSHRRAWLIPAHVDGRRSPAPFASYADAATQLAASARGRRRRSPQ